MIYRFYTLLCLVLISIAAIAQFQERPVNIQSPNASSLIQFSEVPVSYFTGVPSVNIPIYTLKTSKSPVPVSLSYHASGFRPDTHPGWTGLGWNVDAGGVISRKVNSLPDEFYTTTYPKRGFFYQYSLLDTAGWATPLYANLQAFKWGIDLRNDAEPDEFSFNFLNYSGKFYLDEKGKWQVKSAIPLKVIFNNTFIYPPFKSPHAYSDFTSYNDRKYMQSFSGFTITSEDGIQYMFGGDTSSIEFSIGIYEQKQATWVANSWHLKQILYPCGQKVDFNYERILDPYGGRYICSMYESVYNRSYYKKVTGSGGSEIGCSTTSFTLPIYGIYGGDLISPVYLKSVETDIEKIVFEKSASTELKYHPAIFFNQLRNIISLSRGEFFLPYLERSSYEAADYFPSDTAALTKVLNRMVWQKLDKIKIVNKATGRQYKAFSFGYNNKENERLALLNMQEEDSTTLIKKPPYSFAYDRTYINSFDELPPYAMSRQVDHWGYYNGNPADPSLIDGYYAQRNANGLYPHTGVLTKIIYPTGATTYLQYENHDYRKAVPEDRSQNLLSYTSDQKAGGIRIKSIIDSGGFISNNYLRRDYIYKQGYTPTASLPSLSSSGVLGGQSKYFWKEYIQSKGSGGLELKFYQQVFTSNSVLPASNNSAGSHIGYTEVTEILPDKGYITYQYSNFDTDGGANRDELAILNLQPTRTPYEPYNNREHKRGNLLAKLYYDSSGTLVKKEAFEYVTLLPGKYIRALKAISEALACKISTDGLSVGSAYKYYLETVKIKKHITYAYTKGGDSLVASKEFTYDDYKNITSETLVGSKQDTTIIEYKYPYHFPSPPADLSSCMTEHTSCRNDCRIYSKDRDALAACYDDCSRSKQQCEQRIKDNAAKDNVYAQMTAKNMVNSIIEKRTYSVQNGNKYLMRAALSTYKGFYNGKLLQDALYTFESPAFKNITSIINTSFTTKLQFDTAYKLHTKYNYDTSGNTIEQSRTENAISSYIWDYANTFPVAEVQDATVSDIAYSSFEAQNAGGWDNLQISKVLSDSKALTGNRCYNIAGTTLIKNLESLKPYKVSLWAKDNSVRVNGSAADKTGSTVNGWTYYEWKVSGKTLVTISGNCYIDELRMHPEKAQMTTYAYDPLLGITHTCDANNTVSYYDYDSFGRLKYIKDYQGNILKSFNYNYAK